MSIWKSLAVGDIITVRPKRATGAKEQVVVAKVLERTRADGPRFESVDGRLFTFFLYDLSGHTPLGGTADAIALPARPAARRPLETKSVDRKQMSVRVSTNDQGRIRAAFIATNAAERHGTLSEFITRATIEKVEKLEAQYNEGEPWTPVTSTGRPLT